MGLRWAPHLAWSRFDSVSAAGRDLGPAPSIWVLLARRRFAAKAPAIACWIYLDFGGDTPAHTQTKAALRRSIAHEKRNYSRELYGSRGRA